jgi:hypothetical protein
VEIFKTLGSDDMYAGFSMSILLQIRPDIEAKIATVALSLWRRRKVNKVRIEFRSYLRKYLEIISIKLF